MSIIYDIIMLAIIVIAALVGYKRGLISTFLQMVKWIVAFALAVSLCAPVSLMIYDTFLDTSNQNRTKQVVTESVGEINDFSSFTNAIDALSKEYKTVIYEHEYNSMYQSFREMLESGFTIHTALCELIVKPAGLKIIKNIIFIMLFAVIVFLLSFTAKLAQKTNNVPCVGTINKALGMCAGIAAGICISLFVSVGLELFALMSGNRIPWLNDSVLSKTLLARIMISF